MKTRWIGFSFIVLLVLPVSAMATGDMTAQKATVKTIQLGDKNNALRFYPDHLQFETGKLYKLIIQNPSKQKHYFSAEGLARAVFTRKVQIVDRSEKTLVEVKGMITEIEVYPGASAEWWFVPVKTLNQSTLHCSIKGHRQAGMIGNITIR